MPKVRIKFAKMEMKNVPALILLISCIYGSPFAMGGTVLNLSGISTLRYQDKAIFLYNWLTSFMRGIITRVGEKGPHLQADFIELRNEVMKAENDLITGSSTKLNDLEYRVNKLFLEHKAEELNRGESNLTVHAPRLHFFQAKSLIEKSKVFHFLQKMPKGAILHVHNTASVSSQWVVQKMSYMDGMLRCTNKNGVNILSFRTSQSHDCATRYVNISEERNRSKNATQYDEQLEKLINLYTPSPQTNYTNIDEVWTTFQNMFVTLGDALMYIHAFRAYHWQMLKEMYEDDVMYAEVRTSMADLYDNNGRVYPRAHVVTELLDLVTQFRQQYPKFLGIKLIYATNRQRDVTTISTRIDEFKQIKSKFPNFVVGFDLVGQEEKGEPLEKFAALLAESPQSMYFFHAGETNRYGTSTDSNLVDAILLNTKRIGHGYMLMKHPLLRYMVKARRIAIEVCPISNQVLHLTEDLRNHPAGIFMSENVPIVISNDDPGFWNARGLSYDFYYAIMSFAPERSGLEVLKTLAINSLKYSALSHSELDLALSMWNRSWEKFLNKALRGEVF